MYLIKSYLEELLLCSVKAKAQIKVRFANRALVGHFPFVNKLKGSCSQVVCEMVVCHAKQEQCRGLGISRFLASFACQRIKGVLKKSLVIDGSHAISVASFASGDTRIARGRLKCMITAHPSFTPRFSNNTQTTKKSTELPIVMLLFNTQVPEDGA